MAHHRRSELAAFVKHARTQDLSQSLGTIHSYFVAIVIDGLLTTQPLAERNGYN